MNIRQYETKLITIKSSKNIFNHSQQRFSPLKSRRKLFGWFVKILKLVKKGAQNAPLSGTRLKPKINLVKQYV